ncbi:PAS domain S-box protein [Desulfosarcina sp.]|uniref:PAS domain S-box protein n=1 Tax=Desulfosarcina sp. TaxID=2027861 RepID=UPI003970B792
MNQKPSYEELERRVLELEKALRENERTEKVLRQNEDKYHQLFELESDAIFLIDHASGRILEANHAASMMYGFSREELLELRNSDLSAEPESTKQAIHDEAHVIPRRYHKKKDGTTFPVEITGTYFNWQDRKVHIAAIREISWRLQAEDTLREKEQRQQILAASIPGAIFQFLIKADGFHSIPCISAGAEALFGRPISDLTDLNLLLDTIHPDDRAVLRKSILEAAQRMQRWTLEYRILRPDGGITWLRSSSNPQRLPDGSILFNGVLLDITDRKALEEALMEMNTFIQTVLDNLPIGVAVNSDDSVVRFDYMNDNFAKFYRTTRATLAEPGAFWEAVYEDPVFREKIKQRVMEDCASGDPERMQWEAVPITRKGEETTFITARNTMVPGRPLMISSVQDVTNHKRAEDALRESEARLQAIIKSNANPIVVYDTNGLPQYLNPAFTEVFGWTLDELRGQRIPFVPDEQKETTAAKIEELYAFGKPVKFTNKRLTKGGTILNVIVSAAIIKDPLGKGKGMVVNLIDISEQKKLERQLHQAQKMESVARLAGGVAHDYNNMLSVIIGYAELTLEKMSPSDPLHHDLQEILAAAMRSADITRQLLAFARKQTIAPKVLDLNATVEGVLQMLRRLIGEDIDLAWLPGRNIWPVKMDPTQLDQIMANLCVNARDAITDVGKITIETGMATLDEAYCADHPGFIPGNFVMLAVSDDGCGMDKQTLVNLFEPFFTTKAVGRGTGLGLATVYGIVKQNEGFINVSSEPGKGSTFTIYLPKYLGPVIEDQMQPTDSVPKGRGEMVLVVEDEPATLKLAERMLSDLGYKVIVAGTPSKAINLVKDLAGEIHLLITDVVMPEMNGRELSEQLRSLYPALKLLFMSGYTADVIAHRGVLEDGVNFIQKPFSKKDLATMVRQTLGGK